MTETALELWSLTNDEPLAAAPVTVIVGHPFSEITFAADPATGLISVDADDASIAMDAEAFGLVAALMLNALGE